MALFCQSFGFQFNPSTNLMEQVDGIGHVNYESRFDVCMQTVTFVVQYHMIQVV